MKTFDLEATKRVELGKKANKKLRREKFVPGVLYGGKETLHFSVKESAVRKLIYTPHVYIVNLKVEGNSYNAILRELQFHPVTDKMLHFDLLEVSEDKPVVMQIPVKLEGLAEGVKAGGTLNLVSRKLSVKGIYTNFPDQIVVNVEKVKLGGTIKVGQLKLENMELINPKDLVVASVKLTRAAKGAQVGEEGVKAAAGEEAKAAE